MGDREIRVTGTGRLRLEPDLMRLTIAVQGVAPEYPDALKRSAEDTAALRRALAEPGIAPEELKTASFDVDARYESYQTEKGEYRERFVGYGFRHLLSLELERDNDLLGRVLGALAGSGVAAEIHFTFTVRDLESARRELLAAAVADASAKAKALAEAAGVKLGALQRLEYDKTTPCLEARPMRKAMLTDAMAGGGLELDVTPEDIQAEDSVTAVWRIE